MVYIRWRPQYLLLIDLWACFPPIHTHPMIKLLVVFQSSREFSCSHLHMVQGIFFPWIIFRGDERGGLLVLAMVKFSNSPRTSKSSLFPDGGREAVVHIYNVCSSRGTQTRWRYSTLYDSRLRLFLYKKLLVILSPAFERVKVLLGRHGGPVTWSDYVFHMVINVRAYTYSEHNCSQHTI